MKDSEDSLMISLVDLFYYVGLVGYLAIQIFWMQPYIKANPDLATPNGLASVCVGLVAMAKVLK
jgi:hypothetical protein